MTERSIHTDLRASLLNNDPFNYAHLIKFERPSITNELSGQPETFTYLTDAAYNISYDDGTTTAVGGAIPAQTYVANKVLKIGSISESIVPKVGSMSLTLDSSTLGTAVAISATINATAKTIVTDVDLSLYYQEGDKVSLTGAGGNNNQSFIIRKFAASNTVTYTDVIEDDIYTALVNASSVSYSSSLNSEELITLLQAKSSTYTGYLNRRVSIYRAHINPETGTIIGEPYLFFKGLISKGTIKEDVNKGSTITWTLTSHWGDFQRVSGRYTNDDSHRALNQQGIPVPEAALRAEYANDRGFAHAEQAINLNSTYTTMETRTRYQEDQSVTGLGTGANIEYEVPVQRNVDLAFNLSAKYLPVVYGVQKIKGIPIFVDTDRSDSSKVTLVHALCEGPIAGILDMHVDGNPFICVDQSDEDLRGTQPFMSDEERESKTCFGRADLGGVLLGYPNAADAATFNTLDPDLAVSTNGGNSDMIFSLDAFDEELNWADFFIDTGGFTEGATAARAGTGDFANWTHEEFFETSHPLNMKLQLHTGKPFQRANGGLVSRAKANSFHVQKYEERPDLYWTTSHRLLDTAYVVGDYTIAADETTIPEMEFVVQGRSVECHYYDGVFQSKADAAISTKREIFNVGDTVTVKGTNYSQTVIIVERTLNNANAANFLTYDNPANTYNFQFSEDLTLVDTGGGAVTDFFMERTIAKATDAAASAGSNNKTIPLVSTNGLFVGMVVTSATDASNITSNSKIASIVPGVSIVLDKNIAENIGPGDTINFTSTLNLANRIATEQTGTIAGQMKATIDYTNAATGDDGTNRGIKIGVSNASTGFNTLTQNFTIAFTKAVANERSYGTNISAKRSSDSLLDNVNIETLASNRGYTLVYMTDAVYLGSGNYTVAVGDILVINRTSTYRGEVFNMARRVKAYNSTTKVALVDTPYPLHHLPTAGDTWKLFTAVTDSVTSDKRQTINPALHLLDYMTNDRFGAGLDVDTEIDLDSFKAAALKCDQRTNILMAATSAPTVGHIYTYPDTNIDGYTSGDLIWRGTVGAVSAAKTVAGLTLYEVQFTDTWGELVTRMNNFWNLKPDQLAYSTGSVYPAGTLMKSNASYGAISDANALNPASADLEGATVSVREPDTIDFTCHGAANNNLGHSFTYKDSLIRTDSTLAFTETTDGDFVTSITFTPFVFVSGQEYIIVSNQENMGTAGQFTQAGAGNNNVGTVFTANATTCAGTGTVAPTAQCKSASDTLRVGAKYKVVKEGVSIGGAVGSIFTAAATSFTGAGLVMSAGVGKVSRGSALFTDAAFNLYREGTTATLAINAGRASNAGAIDNALLGPARNPIIKGINSTNDGFTETGYTLYDATQVKYWKLVGWSDQTQRNVTRHQCNQVVDTSKPIFSNITKMLTQFNGMLKYSNGKYVLDVKSKHGTATVAEKLDEDDIIGSINVKDGGQKGMFNSISANIIDPQLKFESRQVNFSNSEYLKRDRGVPKKGNYSSPSITNYFNARYNIKQRLDESRSSLIVSFTIGPKGLLLLPGTIIELTYPRFGWASKLLRISDLNMAENGNVSITATEHDDDAYIVPEYRETVMRSVDASSAAQLVTPAPVTNFAASATRGAATLTYDLPSSFNKVADVVRIKKSSENQIATAAVIAEVTTNTYTDTISNTADQTVYYWAEVVSPVAQPSINNSTKRVYLSSPATGSTVTGTGTSAVVKAARVPGNFVFGVSALTDADSSAEIEALFNGSNAPLPLGAIEGDVVSFYTGTQATPTGAAAYERGSSTWVALTTVTAAAGVFGTLSADNFAANTITVGKLSGDVAEEFPLELFTDQALNTSILAATPIASFSIPAPSGGVAKKPKLTLEVSFKVETTSAAQNVFTDFLLKRKSKGAVTTATGVLTLGAAAIDGSVVGTLIEELKIAGNVLGSMSSGRISDTHDASTNSYSIYTMYYSAADNATYIRIKQPAFTSGNIFDAGDNIFFSPDSFTATGGEIAVTSPIQTGINVYVETGAQSVALRTYAMQAVLGKTTTATEFILSAQNGAAYGSGVTAKVTTISGSMEHIV